MFATCLWSCLCVCAGPWQTQPLAAQEPQSPPRPTPAWLKLVDYGATDPRFKGYFLPEGLKLEVVAQEPAVINPVGIRFDNQGTLHALEWLPDPKGSNFPQVEETVRYKDGSTRRITVMKKNVKDVVKALHRDADGQYRKATVVQEFELPSSLLFHDGWLYLSGRGSVWRFRRSKEGGPYDVKEEIARGFCGFHHHQVSGLSIGNDGWLYITAGDDDNFAEGHDGSRATVLRTGAVFRCRPDGAQLQVYAIGFRNPYRDVAFDAAFQMFHVDNDNEDGSKFTGCRLMHIPEGADFGWRLQGGAKCCVPDHLRGAVVGERPGKMPPLLKTGRGAPAGLLIYNDSFLPERFQGLLLYPDVYRKVVRAYRVEPQGASFTVIEEFEFLKSDDPLFRPCQMIVGPDGAIYLCDWRTDSGGAGRLSGDGKHGRIYRLTWAGTAQEPAIPTRPLDSWHKLVTGSPEGLLQALASPNFTDRGLAARELVRRGATHRPALLKLVLDEEASAVSRMTALGALQSLWNEEVKTACLRLLGDAHPDLRRLAVEALGLEGKPGDASVLEPLVKMLVDRDHAVRRSAALALGRIGGPLAADALVNAYRFDDSRDLWLQDGLLRGIELLGSLGVDRLISLADSGRNEDRQVAVRAFTGFRARPAALALPRLLANPHLTEHDHQLLLRSFKDYLLDPPISLEPVLDWLEQHPHAPAPSKLAALESLSAGGALKGDRAAKLLIHLLPVEADEGVRLSALRAVQEMRVQNAGPVLLEMLPQPRSTAERTALLTALAALQVRKAVPALEKVLGDESWAELHPDVLRTLAALDAERGKQVAQGLFTHPQAPVVAAALAVLGNSPEGAKLVGQAFLDKKIAPEFLPQVTEALRKHAERHPELGPMLKAILKGGLMVSTRPEDLARLQQLVTARGNPQRGQHLFLNAKTLQCINCHKLEGIGGNVGPDLTRVWETHTVEKLLEAMLEPNKEIKEGYQTYVALTKAGQIHRGLQVAKDARQIILRDADGKEVRLAMADVEEYKVSDQSLMPDNVVSQLSYDQFLDLLAFLKSRAAQEALRGQIREFWLAGPFDADLDTAFPPEQHPDPQQPYKDGSGTEQRWQVHRAEPEGYLNLRQIYRRDFATVYALAYVYSPQPQKVELRLGSDDWVKVWVNGKVVHQAQQQRTAVPDQDRVPLQLSAGWTPVLFKVVNQGGGYGLHARIAGGEGVRVSTQPSSP